MRSFLFEKEKLNELYQTKRIVVASGCSGSGVSFVSEIIALGLSKIGSCSLIELGKAHFYDSLGFEKRFLGKDFVDYYNKIKNGEHIAVSKKNSFKDVHWIVKSPKDIDNLSTVDIFRLFYTPKDEYCVFDCSGLDQETTLSLLAEADYPIIVIDPLPSKLAISRPFLEKLRISMPNAVLIVNQMNNGVHISELIHFLGTKDFFSLSSVPQEYIYKAEYNSLPVSCMPELSQTLAKAQDMLSKIFQ